MTATLHPIERHRPTPGATPAPTASLPAEQAAPVAGWPTTSPRPAGAHRFFTTGADGDALYHDRRRLDQPVTADRRAYSDEYRAGVHAALRLAPKGPRP